MALQHIVDHSSHNIFNGDFNVNWLVEAERESLYVMVRDNGYRKLVDNPTTDHDNKHLLTIYIYIYQQYKMWKLSQVV